MPKTAAKRKEVNGKSDEEMTSRGGRFPRGTAAAELPVVPLVVSLEAASHARVSTPSLIETSTSKLSSPFQIFQPHSTPSCLHVSRRVCPLSSRTRQSILTSAIALRSRQNV